MNGLKPLKRAECLIDIFNPNVIDVVESFNPSKETSLFLG
jgi:hypothetical protein